MRMAGIRGKSGPPANQNAFKHGLAGIPHTRYGRFESILHFGLLFIGNEDLQLNIYSPNLGTMSKMPARRQNEPRAALLVDPNHSSLTSSFSPNSLNAPLVSSTFCFETPSCGATSTLTVTFNPLPVTKRDRTLV